MSERVVFYRLSRKFVDDESSIPDKAADVLYYTLAVGHHTGVMDCFETALEMPLDAYERIVALIDDDKARFKLEGVMRFSEIEISKEHVSLLLPACRAALANLDVFNECGKTSIQLSEDDVHRLMAIIGLLVKVRDEPGMYLTVRKAL